MKKWTREETIIAFNAYCKIPFQKSSKTHPTVINYAKILGRTPSALNMKIGNIGRLDPDLKKQGIRGLLHGAKLEEEIWNEFIDNPEQLAFESEKLIAQFSQQKIEEFASIEIKDLPQGVEREVIIRQRVNQSFFRSVVMSSYGFRCCISGVGTPELLEACHIVGWAHDLSNRTNPQNGLCLNSFFHKSYDKHLLSITPDFTIIVSEELLHNTMELSFNNYLKGLNGKNIMLPDRFPPKKEFLEIHFNEFKQRQ